MISCLHKHNRITTYYAQCWLTPAEFIFTACYIPALKHPLVAFSAVKIGGHRCPWCWTCMVPELLERSYAVCQQWQGKTPPQINQQWSPPGLNPGPSIYCLLCSWTIYHQQSSRVTPNSMQITPFSTAMGRRLTRWEQSWRKVCRQQTIGSREIVFELTWKRSQEGRGHNPNLNIIYSSYTTVSP